MNEEVTISARDFPGALCYTGLNEEIVSHKKKQKRVLLAKLKAIKEMKHLRNMKRVKDPDVISDWSSTDYEQENHQQRQERKAKQHMFKIVGLGKELRNNRIVKGKTSYIKKSKTPRIGKRRNKLEKSIRLGSVNKSRVKISVSRI